MSVCRLGCIVEGGVGVEVRKKKGGKRVNR